jgi:LemA protein
MNPLSYTLAGLAVVGFIIGSETASVNNHLAIYQQQVVAAKSQVDNQLQRRTDLIDNLVETVKGYAGHESSTLTAVITARDTGDSSKTVISALVEAYPNLKADKHFSDLQTQIEGTENRLGTARRDLILRIQTYDTQLTLFPSNLVNNLFLGYQPETAFTVNDAVRVRPKVNFGKAG